VLDTIETMSLVQYYKSAKKIGEEVQDSSILSALNYDSENDHPSQWVPMVQKALFTYFKKFPNAEKSDEIIKVYVQGEILEDREERNLVVKAGLICLMFGVVIGWFLGGGGSV